MIVVLRDSDFHFQGQTFSCCAYACAADVFGRFASTRTTLAVELFLLCNCSILIQLNYVVLIMYRQWKHGGDLSSTFESGGLSP